MKIALEHVVREEYELLILRNLMETPFGSALVLKGGTALRLAYSSPRFSDDLDFSLLALISEELFARVAELVVKMLPQVTLVEALSKRFTLFAFYEVREPYQPRAFSIKLEVSKRPQSWERERDFTLRLLTSLVTPVSVLAQVATLERMWTDKQSALAARRQPRDLYDLWFIAQKLRCTFMPDPSGFEPQAIRRELRKYLPRSHWQVIDQWSG